MSPWPQVEVYNSSVPNAKQKIKDKLWSYPRSVDGYVFEICCAPFCSFGCCSPLRLPLVTNGLSGSASFDYIEGWYNPHRRHSAIHYESPMNFERHVHHQVA